MSEHETRFLGEPAEAWIEQLASDDPIRRRLAAYALGEIGTSGRGTAAALRARLQDPVHYVRTWAAAALARVEPGSDEALEALRSAAREDEDFVRSLAAWLLGRVASPDQVDDVRAIVEPLLDDPDASVRAEAARALERMERAQRGLASP